jgi:hypothetical protein
MFRTLVIAATLALSACATTPAYAPAAAQGGAGYSERQIESNRYFVTYRAPSGADQSLLHDYALLRAADITLENGRSWFWVDRRTFDGEAPRRGGASIGFGIGSARWSGNSSIGTSVGVSVPVGVNSGASARAATLEIRLGEGPKPDDANAYDARAIATNIRTRQTP